ncbi:Rv3235 family protein [Streptomyces sp. NPDC021224]|uniref:Rv3235 family protein n=1 Tax=unclassified Streptomyces TaxID=2593676 RepID=UPI00379BB844
MPQPPHQPAASAPLPAAGAPPRRPRGAGAAPPGRRDPRRPGGRPPAGRVPGGVLRPQSPHDWFAGRLLDVLTGRQPLTMLAGKVRDEAYQRLWELHARRADWRPRGARGRTPFVYRCHPFRTAGGALEVCAVVCLGQDVFRALAFRLEAGGPDAATGYGPERWRCTAVEAA